MGERDDGGPAFPTTRWRVDATGVRVGTPHDGMSLRDWFAGKALAGMLASAPVVDRTKVKKDVWAGVAYDFADAMLLARKEKQND